MPSSDQENCAQNAAQNTAPTKLLISQLNDKLRRDWIGGRIVWTTGVEQLGTDVNLAIFDAVNEFEAFTPENDPYGEHDFGAVEIAGHRIFWKIDYYDEALECGSPDPSNPAVTTRVLTIMLASEY